MAHPALRDGVQKATRATLMHVPRWRSLLLLLAGLGLAGAGLWVLLTAPVGETRRGPPPAPHGEIDAASRRALEQALHEQPEDDVP